MRLAALILLALFLGCTSVHAPAGPCGRLFYASGFSAQERASLDSAASRWNVIATEQFCIADGAADEHSIRRVEVGGPEWKAIVDSFNNGGVLGVHYGGSDNIVIMSGLDAALFEVVALHELGHAHGIGHTPPPSVMHNTVGTADDFTAIDIAECRHVGACPNSSAPGQEPISFGPVDYILVRPE